MSMKNSCGNIGNRMRELPVCSAVRKPTAPLALLLHSSFTVHVSSYDLVQPEDALTRVATCS